MGKQVGLGIYFLICSLRYGEKLSLLLLVLNLSPLNLVRLPSPHPPHAWFAARAVGVIKKSAVYRLNPVLIGDIQDVERFLLLFSLISQRFPLFAQFQLRFRHFFTLTMRVNPDKPSAISPMPFTSSCVLTFTH